MSKKTAPPVRPYKPIVAYPYPDEHDQIQAEAEEQGRSISNYILMVLRLYRKRQNTGENGSNGADKKAV